MKKDSIKIAALADIHVHDGYKDYYKELFTQISGEANILVIAGDLTQRGLLKEAEVLLKELAHCTIPVITVLGNHDFESGEHEEMVKLLCEHKVSVLDGDSAVIEGVGFAGVKGFCGGFDDYMLGLWGEQAIKDFYYEGVNEAEKLERALAQLQTDKKVAVLHYAPIKKTVEGESPEIFTYLGSSKLEHPLNSYSVTVAFHGHAHNGNHEGKTSHDIPVYNVAYPLMKHMQPKKPYLLFEI